MRFESGSSVRGGQWCAGAGVHAGLVGVRAGLCADKEGKA